MHKRKALIYKGGLAFMSKFINGLSHGSNSSGVKGSDSAVDDTFWDDSESLLDVLSENASSMPVLVCIKEGKGVFDFGNAFAAAKHTLQLIKYAYSHGNLLDSYLLLRRLFESVMQYYFFYALKHDYIGRITIKNDGKSFEDLVESMGIMIERMEFDDSSISDVSIFHQWAVGNNLDQKAEKKRRKVILLDHYLKSLDALNPDIKACKEKYLEPGLTEIQKIMNDYTHGNALYTMTLAFDANVHVKKIFENRLSYVLSILLVYTTLCIPQLMQSSDYVDAMDCGMTPEPDCQYWIAPCIQHYFDIHVSKIHPELVKYLKVNNPAGMIIETPELRN